MKGALTKWREEHIPKPPRKILVVQGTHGEHRTANPHKASLHPPSLQTVQPPPAKRDLRAPKHLFFDDSSHLKIIFPRLEIWGSSLPTIDFQESDQFASQTATIPCLLPQFFGQSNLYHKLALLYFCY